ncbi:MAG: Na+/H+ antiporter NhaA [Gemmatimonadetes bacterium]|nr:Na+/H+ antiporter NhaA [Gemmatimonadota bacterium]
MTDPRKPDSNFPGFNRPGTRHTLVRRLVTPFGEFFRAESASGIVLLICAALALLWANSPWGESYFHLWETHVVVGGGPIQLDYSLHHWINDGLMAVFFFMVGLEIKREVLVGELASPKKAALPIAAAIGGMVVPALIYVAFNAGTPELRGWGVPMATDIAFALGVLALLGSRAPTGLKIFLAALAIVDDLGAVLVIALFYSEGIDWNMLMYGGLTLIVLFGANRGGIRRPAVYAALGVVLWYFFLKSGVHATIAGVLLAITIPARTKINVMEFVGSAREYLQTFEADGVRSDPSGPLTQRQESALERLEEAAEGVQSPLLSIEHALVPWVAFGIMPLFALANAGVALEPEVIGGVGSPVVLGIALGLLIGKPIGIAAFAAIAVKLGLAGLPAGVRGMHLVGVGLLGGIGFTMSLFIANLAFTATTLELAKVGVLGASTVAGVAGYFILRSRGNPGMVTRAGAQHAHD